ncbi:hypothetical protein ABIA39_000767 [Nocardia sp. GAS34]|uniref:cobalamin biosynthesis protein n=1 Tax=unclassified Nocardia TaxID=2637762 RepID=UPI003D1F31EE
MYEPPGPESALLGPVADHARTRVVVLGPGLVNRRVAPTRPAVIDERTPVGSGGELRPDDGVAAEECGPGSGGDGRTGEGPDGGTWAESVRAGLAGDRSAISGPVVGVGCRPGTAGETIVHAVREIVGDSGVRCLATVDRRAREPGFQRAARELRASTVAFSPAELAEVEVPNPAQRTAAALATASVAEAAALLACVKCYGTGHLVVTKTVIDAVTIAVARPGSA